MRFKTLNPALLSKDANFRNTDVFGTLTLPGFTNVSASLAALSSSASPYFATSRNTINTNFGNNTISGSIDLGGILGGSNNLLIHDRSFIIGSNITSSAVDTVYVENLHVSGSGRIKWSG